MQWLNLKLCILVLLVGTVLLNTRTGAEVLAPTIEKETVNAVVLPILPADLMAAGGCESNHSPKDKPKQFHENGSVVTHKNYNKAGVWTSTDYGAFQINSIHLAQAKELGLDFINSEEDNYKMAKIIYDQQGIGAWKGYDPARKTCSYY